MPTRSNKPDRFLGLSIAYFILIFIGLNSFTEQVSADLKDAKYNKAPLFSLPDIHEKNTVNLSDYKGKVVLVDFWASWCGPCRQSMPEYNQLRKRLHSKQNGKDFEILAVNVDVTTEEAMRFLEQYPVDFPVLEERSGKSQQAYELLTMPTSFLIDREGYIRIAHQGFNTGFIRYLEKEVNMLLQE